MVSIENGEVKTALSVGEVAERSGVAVSAIHFYEKKGLIDSWRNAGNQRRFHRGVLRRIAVIKVAQRLGIPLSEIGETLATLPTDRTVTSHDWQRLSEQWKSDLNHRIELLVGLRDQLTSCIGCGCLSIDACRLRNPWDELGDEGPGARLLDSDAPEKQTLSRLLSALCCRFFRFMSHTALLLEKPGQCFQ